MVRLSVYLLKEGFTPETALKEDARTTPVPVAVEGAIQGRLHFASSGRPEPAWFKLFRGALTPPFSLDSRGVSALYLLEVDARCFALAFGHGRSMLAPGSWEERFGLKVTLNLVDPDKLRSIDRRVFDTVMRQGREQVAEPTQATNFGLNIETDLVRGVAGEPLDPYYGSKLFGADVLAADVAVTIEALPELLGRYLAAFSATTYRARFEWIDHMGEVTDASKREALDQVLLDRIRRGEHEKLWLAVPEIVDPVRVAGYAFTRRKGVETQADLHLRYLFQGRRDRGTVGLDDLKRWSAVAFDGAGEPTGEEWAVHRCLCFEHVEADHVYLLADGKWYRIARSYVDAVEESFRAVVSASAELPPYDAASEAEYNQALAGPTFKLIDRKLARLGGDPIEPCDLYGADGRLVFVKRYSNSKPMSHLFGQALVAGDAFKSEEAFRKQFKALLGRGFPFEARNFKAEEHPIVLGIVSWASRFDLPFFSKVTLRHTANRLRNYGYTVRVVQIVDERARRERGGGAP